MRRVAPMDSFAPKALISALFCSQKPRSRCYHRREFALMTHGFRRIGAIAEQPDFLSAVIFF
jgi:hypothetical protein